MLPETNEFPIIQIEIAKIKFLNPRTRNKVVHEEIKESIKKTCIQQSERFCLLAFNAIPNVPLRHLFAQRMAHVHGKYCRDCYSDG